MAVSYLTPDWPAPSQVRAVFSLRGGGVSSSPFDSLNVAAHVGDDSAHVSENRRRLMASLKLPAEPSWLEQTHGTEVSDLDAAVPVARADAAVARGIGRICAIQVADCLPVFLAARSGAVVAAAHCGWRGLSAGVLEATTRAMGIDPAEIIAWLGPAIGPEAFEVGEEVRRAFLTQDERLACAFVVNARGRWQCDLHAIARQRLAALKLQAVFGAEVCTSSDPARFFSYRRDGRCGRMAALIWRSHEPSGSGEP